MNLPKAPPLFWSKLSQAGAKRLWALLTLMCLSVWSLSPALATEDQPRVPGAVTPTLVRELPEGWQEVSSPHFRIQAPPELLNRAQGLLQGAEAERRNLLDQLDPSALLKPGGQDPFAARPYVVRLVKDEAMFQQVQPGQPPEWAAGVAYPSLGLMVLRLDRNREAFGTGSLETTFRHELVHLLLGDLFGDRPVPRFLDEGLARLLAREASIDEFVALSQAVVFNRLIPFSMLESRFPEQAGQAELAYAQSREFLSYLIGRFGPAVLPGILKELREGESLNEALWQHTRLGLKNLEHAWQDRLDASFAWISALGGGMTLLWGVAGLLLIAGWARRREQSRARHARWDEEEALEQSRIQMERALIRAAQLRRMQGALTTEPPLALYGRQLLAPGGPRETLARGAHPVGASVWRDPGEAVSEEEEDDDDDGLTSSDRSGSHAAERSGNRGEGAGAHGSEGSEGHGAAEDEDDVPFEPIEDSNDEETEDSEDRPPPGGWLH